MVCTLPRDLPGVPQLVVPFFQYILGREESPVQGTKNLNFTDLQDFLRNVG